MGVWFLLKLGLLASNFQAPPQKLREEKKIFFFLNSCYLCTQHLYLPSELQILSLTPKGMMCDVCAVCWCRWVCLCSRGPRQQEQGDVRPEEVTH